VKKNLMLDSDGAVVRAGQTIFEIEPDETLVEESAEARAARRKRVTLAALGG
jgi:multidrug efflux pump subunit AcrA (membrane-fusion protein)